MLIVSHIKKRVPLIKYIVGFILILSLILGSGCVIQRLLKFKKQLNSPSQYIDFSNKGAVLFTDPILRLEDIVLLTGVLPTTVIDDEVIYELNRVDFPGNSLVFRLIFENKGLVAIDYPDQLFDVISSAFLTESLKMFGQSDLAEGNKSLVLGDGGQVSSSLIPTKQQIIYLLGKPSKTEKFPTLEYLTYHYDHPIEGGQQQISISIVFFKSHHKIKSVVFDLPDRRWKLNF